ncbi:MAG: hypothetical protein V3R16_02515 [Nitrospirales bacterium]
MRVGISIEGRCEHCGRRLTTIKDIPFLCPVCDREEDEEPTPVPRRGKPPNCPRLESEEFLQHRDVEDVE